MQAPKVIISGGGTGGHIFPAIATANALKMKNRAIDILFVGAEDKMEMEKVPAAGYPIEGLWISGLQRKISFKNLLFPFKLISSLMKAKRILKRFQPDVVVGFGGFASGPVLYAAAKRGIPTIIQEQNSYAGITNKILGKKAAKICVAYDNMDKFFPKDKLVITGNPVRQDITQLEGKKERGLEHFGLSAGKKTLLIVGGSLGARSINQAVVDNLETLRENQVQVIWQTGKLFIEQAKKATEGLNSEGIIVTDFIGKMDYAYAVADMVISRAGAIAVSELSLTSKASVLVPFPFAAEDHQTKNAMALVNHNAAILVKDAEAGEKLIPTALEVLKDDEQMEKLSRNISGLSYKDSADIIANEILHLINK